jgi:hypothetical protein
MAFWNKGLTGAGPLMLIGVAGMVLGPTLLRLAGRATRPVARTALRSGVDVFDRTREGFGGLREGFGGLIEESRGEMKSRGQRERPGAKAQARRGARPLGEDISGRKA